MTKARMGLLLLVALGVGLFLATAVRAEPPGGDGDEKRSLAPAVAGKKNGKHGWLFECTAQVVIRKFCRDHGVTYCETTLWRSWREVLHHLDGVGAGLPETSG